MILRRLGCVLAGLWRLLLLAPASSQLDVPSGSGAGLLFAAPFVPPMAVRFWNWLRTRMLGETKAYSGFAVDDLERAREFYAGTLGLRTSMEHGLMWLHLAGGRDALVYPQPDATSASYTILNFGVDDIEAAVDALAARGVRFECSEDVQQDERGIARGDGPDIAWFKDPAGNVLAVLHEA